MRRRLLIAVGIVLAPISGTPAADPAKKGPEKVELPAAGGAAFLKAEDSATEILRKVIDAYGGREKLKQWRCGHLHYRTKIIVDPTHDADAEMDEYFEYPGRFKRVARMTKNGETSEMTFVINKEIAWMHDVQRGVRPLPSSSLPAVDRKEHQFAVFDNFSYLEEKGITLENLGKKMVGDRPTVALRAKGEGRPETEMYFDLTTGLLLKTRVNDPVPTVFKGLVETTHSDFKRFQGVVFPTKLQSVSNGKTVMEIDLLELTFLDKLEDSLFTPPK